MFRVSVWRVFRGLGLAFVGDFADLLQAVQEGVPGFRFACKYTPVDLLV